MMSFTQQKHFAQFKQSKSKPSPTINQPPQRKTNFIPQQILSNQHFHQQSQPVMKTVERIQDEASRGVGVVGTDGMSEDFNRLRSQLKKLEEYKRTPLIQGTYQTEIKANNSLIEDIHLQRKNQLSTNSHTAHSIFKPQAPTYNQEKKSQNEKICSLLDELQLLKKQRDGLKVELVSKEDEIKMLRLREGEIERASREERQRCETELRTRIQAERQNFQAVIKQLQEELTKTKQEKTPESAFDQALKAQIHKNQQLRLVLQQKTEQLSSLKDISVQQLKTIDHLQTQSKIKELKAITEHKSALKRLQIQLTEQTSEIISLNKNLKALQTRYQSVLRDIDQKDEFIMRHLVNRTAEKEQPEIRQILEQYKQTFKNRGCIDGIELGQQEISRKI